MDIAVATRVANVTARLAGKKIFGRWNGYEELASEWGERDEHYNKIPVKDFPEWHEILFASYGGGSYDGDAIVIFSRNGKLYENQDSHCSCHGLENWAPEETTAAALGMRDRARFLNDHEEEAREAYWRLVDSMQNYC